jgi:hypothetical protein
MTLVSEARSYADSALESGKTTLSTVVEKLQSLPVDAKERAGTVADDSRDLAASAAAFARRNVHAWVGAADALIANCTKRAEEVQEESRKNAAKLVDDTKSRLSDVGEFVESMSAKSQELAEKAQERVTAVAVDAKELGTQAYSSARLIVVEDLRFSTKEAIDSHFNKLVSSFNDHADRGEKVVTGLRRKTAETVDPDGQSATAVAVDTTSASKTPVSKTPVSKTPVSKTPVSKTPVSKTPAKNASARKTSAKKVTAAG